MSIFLIALLSLGLCTCIAFAISLVRKDNGTADIAYGLGFMVLAWVTYILGTHSVIGFIATILLSVWALRLSVRIYLRSRGRPEDFRYAAWRKAWKKHFLARSFLQIYLLQGVVIFAVALPVTLLNIYGGEVGLGLLGMLGLSLWVIGFLFEAVGDAQLDRFTKDPAHKGMVMDKGLWRYTRHPNYFGESLMWLALALISYDTLSLTTETLFAFVPFLSPVLITTLLLSVSGIPLVEKRLSKTAGWAVYKKRTSAFIPFPPRKAS